MCDLPIGHKHHGGVSVAVAVALGRLNQSLDSASVRYSRVRSLPLAGRFGVTVRFTMAGVTSFFEQCQGEAAKRIRDEAAFWKAQAAQPAQATLLSVRFFAHFWLESDVTPLPRRATP